MTKKYISKPIYLLLFTVVLLNSCNGQTKTESQTDNVTQPIEIPIGQPKMLKSQGKYTYRTATGPYSDTSVSISSIIEDKNGNIWSATMGEGVYRYDGKSFVNFTVKNGLATNLVYTMIEDKDGNIWFGTTDGVSRYNGKSFTNIPFSIINGSSNAPFSIKSNDPLKLKEHFSTFKEVWSLLQDRTGKIWLGTTDGVYRYDGEKFTSIADLDASKNSNIIHVAVTSLAEDEAGNIWFTSWTDGLCRFDGKSITKVSPNDLGFNSMMLDRNGNFWLGRRNENEGGVFRFDGKIFTKVFIERPYIVEMEEDNNGNVWFSHVPNGGVIHYNPSTSEIIAHFSEKNGLPSNHISSITADKTGKVWFGMSDMILISYDGKTFTDF